MINFIVSNDELLLCYRVADDGRWLIDALKNDSPTCIGKAFYVSNDNRVDEKAENEHLLDEPIDGHEFLFVIGHAVGNYFKILKDVLDLEFELFIAKNIQLERKMFVAHRNISIFRRFNKFQLKTIKIGGEDPNAIPEEIFKDLLNKFPTSTEVDHYARSRISAIIRNYLPIEDDYQAKYENYLNKKESFVGSKPLEFLGQYESNKYDDLVTKMQSMLENSIAYTEAQWQDEILEIIQLLFPRYIRAFKEGPVNDSWAKKNRRVDFLLVDASGFIDIIEIKKPADSKLISANRYRDNHVPIRELNGTIMQVEKYLYHFSRWGEKGEKILNAKFGSTLPNNFDIKIVNPNGIIIMGRDHNLSVSQKNDFEVIRRKYRNVLDIITYDDLLRRLEIIREKYNFYSNAIAN